MADLIAYQDGNLTGATTFKAIATGTGASASTFTLSLQTDTSYTDSSAFTVTNGQVIEGLLLYCNRNNTTGTVTVALSDDNGVTATREVTVNASDLPSNLSWVFFKFGSTLTADGGSDYKIKVKGSSASNARFACDTNSGNVVRRLRTSTTATPTTGDVLYVIGELTGTGSNTPITVTMNETSTTAYGEVNVCSYSSLTYGTSASTNYYLKLTGNLNVWDGGTLNIGTSGTPIPSTSTAVLEFNCGSNVQYGLEVRDGSTVGIYGATKANTKVLLTADANSGQKVVTVQDTTGWSANDEIAIASTTRTASQSEKATISTVDSGTQVTVSANLSATHQGTSPYQGEVVNLTRNVKIRGMSASLQSYVNCAATSTFRASYAEFYWLGSNTNSKKGIDFAQTSAGTASITYCSLHDNSVGGGQAINATGTSGSPTIDNNVFYHLSGIGIVVIGATSGTPTVTNNWAMGSNANPVFSLSDVGGTITGNRAVGGAAGFNFNESATLGTFSDNIAHSSDVPLSASTTTLNIPGTILNCKFWRGNQCYWYAQNTIFDGCEFYHHTNQNLNTSGNRSVILRNCTFNGGSGQSLSATTTAWTIGAGLTRAESCNFGQTTTHSTRTFVVGGGLNYYNVTCVNCTFADSLTPLAQTDLNDSLPIGASFIGLEKLNGTSGNHRAYKRYGYSGSDQSVFRTSAPSEVLVPNSAAGKLPSGSKKFGVANTKTATVTVYVNKSATYNGNQPRLIVKKNVVGGIASDTVLATASGGTGSWLKLEGTTAAVTDDCVLEVYVDCDGTAGTVYVDDFFVS